MVLWREGIVGTIEGSFLSRLAGILTHIATLPARNGKAAMQVESLRHRPVALPIMPMAHPDKTSGDPAALQTGSLLANPELDGVRVKVPGFVVPLERAKDGLLSDFFLVPYFGACIHVPPPPPNQIVYVRMRSGAGLRSIEDAMWVTGTLHIASKTTSLGAASYTLDGEKLEVYEYHNP
jgi:hypothetical protein